MNSHNLQPPALASLVRGLFTSVCALLACGCAWALEIQPYSAQELARLQSSNKPVGVHFHAEWCATCKTQEKALQSLRTEPSLSQVTLLVADYDKEKDLRRRLRVPAQSTLLVFRGGTEVARVGGETSADKLRAALIAAVRAP